MAFQSMCKTATALACFLSLSAVAADIKEHTRTVFEFWDYEITAKGTAWTVEAYLGADFSIHVPEIEQFCPQKRLQFPMHHNGPFERMFDTVMAAKSMNSELIVKFRKAPRQKIEPRCEIHSIAVKGEPERSIE